MTEHPPLHVVVPVLDQPEHTLALLACLARQTAIPARVWIMDNGSNEESRQAVEDGCPHELVALVDDCKGMTIYECWNRGFWKAQRVAYGDPFHVLVTNNDVLLPEWAAEVMSQALLADETRGVSYPDWKATHALAAPPVAPLRGSDPVVAETQGVWGSDGMLGYCFMLAGHRIPWRPLIQDLAYEWWYGDNALADSLAHAGLKQVKCLGMPIVHAHEGTAHAFDLGAKKERDARLWATRRRLDQVDRLNRGNRVVQHGARRDWRARPPTRPGPGA